MFGLFTSLMFAFLCIEGLCCWAVELVLHME